MVSKSESRTEQPRSIREIRILNTAEQNPEATLEEIAEQIPTVTTDHVERVFEQYGDPAADGDNADDPSKTQSNDDTNPNPDSDPVSDSNSDPDTQVDEPAETDTPELQMIDHNFEDDSSESMDRSQETAIVNGNDPDVETSENPLPDRDDLTQKELETLRAICYEPDATQKQIANMLSISRATVSNRTSAIAGFEWADREEFVDEFFDEKITISEPPGPNNVDNSDTANNPHEQKNRVVTDNSSEDSEEIPQSDDELDAASNNGYIDGASTGSQPSDASTNSSSSGSQPVSTAGGEQVADTLEELSERLTTIEKQIQRSESTAGETVFEDAEVVHKVVAACMDAEKISEDEELQIIKELM